MKFLILLLLYLIYPTIIFANDKKLPFNLDNVQNIYKLNNGNKIYVEQYERGDRIWEEDILNNKINNISFVWNFISLAKKCEGIENENIYFATNLEYYLGGGTNIDNPQIRIFSLNDPSPWRDSDLGIVPNIEWANSLCDFYKPLDQ
ncbi:hypothetical protein N9U27_02270 [Candidatus Pelagibacter sp.]|nr:hypothetical protein [Candidatus Pelagibacter sp.]